MSEYVIYLIGIIMAISGIVNVVLISRYNPYSKKNMEKRMELVEQIRECNKKHKS